MKNLSLFLSKQKASRFEISSATISILQNPKEVLTNKLNKKFWDELVTELQTITSESFGAELQTQTTDGVRNVITNVDTLAILHNQDEILGFASSRNFLEDGVLYLFGVAIAKKFKGNGTGTALVRAMMDELKLTRIGFTTQNPIMFALLKNICSEVYPSPENPIVPEKMRELGKKVVGLKSEILDEKSFVILNLYGRCLYKVIPDSKNTELNEWFKNSLRIIGGQTRSAFLFIGETKLS